MTDKKTELEKMIDDLRTGSFVDMQNRLEELEGDHTSDDFKELMESFEPELENLVGQAGALLTKVKEFLA